MESAGERGTSGEEKLAVALGIGVEEATSAVAAVGMVSALLSSRDEAPEDLLKGMVDAQVISPADRAAVSRLIPALAEITPAVTTAVTKQMLMNAVLPSFRTLDLVLDVRLGNEDGFDYALPVAVAYLGTDASSQRLWFQMTKADVEGLLRQFEALLKKFNEAEGLVKRLFPKAGGV